MSKRIIYAYRYGIVGGVTTQLLLREKALRECGIECHIFFSQDNGVGNVLIKGERRNIHFGSHISLKKLVRRLRPEAVIVIDSPELMNAAMPFGCKHALLAEVHTTTQTGMAYLETFRKSDVRAVMVPSNYSARLVNSRVPDLQTVVLPNVLDGAAFGIHSSAARQPDTGQRNFVWVGKLDNHKNWQLGLIYLRVLQQLHGDVRLNFVGGYTASQERSAQFFQLAHKLGLHSNVVWLDFVENQSLAEIYNACRRTGGAMLVTSRDESFGMAAAEALLCGCPIISNDLPVFHEVFPSSPHIQMIDIWQPTEFHNAAGRLSTEDMQESQRVRKSLLERFSPEVFTYRFRQFLDAVG